MSDDETLTISGQTKLLTAEYKDGQLQIVEVTPFDKDKNESVLPDMMASDGDQQRYMQVVDPNKGLMQLDLLNLTLVRCDDGEESYRLVTSAESEGGELNSDTVTCVLQSSDGEEQNDRDSYVIMDGENGPLVLCQSSIKAEPEPEPAPPTPAPEPKKPARNLSAAEILEKAKVLQKAKAIISQAARPVQAGKRGRKRAADQLPAPHALLSSPNFKLYLYTCKLCPFKCNAIKELAQHRAKEHDTGNKFRTGAGMGPGLPHYIRMQCARCPFQGATHWQLMKHVQATHLEVQTVNKVSLDSKEVEEADVLVCGACGFESAHRQEFRQHIENEHGATTT